LRLTLKKHKGARRRDGLGKTGKSEQGGTEKKSQEEGVPASPKTRRKEEHGTHVSHTVYDAYLK